MKKLLSENKKELLKALSQNLPILRAKLNISQNDFADILGVSRQTISAFETGQRDIPWSVFLASILVFFKNTETKRLLVAFEIYTPELDNFLTIDKTENS